MTTARLLAAKVLIEVIERDAYANLLLPHELATSGLTAADRGFTTELVYGTIRNQAFYDEVIGDATRRTTASLDLPVLVTLRLTAHQHLSLHIASHAVVDQAVRLVRDLGVPKAAGLVNAASRRITERAESSWIDAVRSNHDPEQFLATRYSHPAWIVEAFRHSLEHDGRADDLEALLAADNTAPSVNLVALPGIASRDSAGLATTSFSPIGMIAPSGDPSRSLGRGIRVQDQGSQLVALALTRARAIADGERWLDTCAGPGGKTALLAAEGAGRVVLSANEPLHHRADLVRAALRDVPFAVDVTERMGQELLGESDSAWDRILIDAPCTGLGALRRRPEARWRKGPSDLRDLTRLQFDLLSAATAAIKPGGIIAYATCSPHLAETERQIKRVLKESQNVEMLDTAAVLSSIAPGIPLGTQSFGVQLWPQVHASDAMFVSLLTRTH